MGNRNLAFVAYTNSPSVPAIGEQEFLKELSATTLPYRPPRAASPHLSRSSSTSSSPQKIAREKKIPSLDATEWTLSNGMKVIYKNLAKELKGEVLFLASAKGGQSIVKPADLPSFSAMQSLIIGLGPL